MLGPAAMNGSRNIAAVIGQERPWTMRPRASSAPWTAQLARSSAVMDSLRDRRDLRRIEGEARPLLAQGRNRVADAADAAAAHQAGRERRDAAPIAERAADEHRAVGPRRLDRIGGLGEL